MDGLIEGRIVHYVVGKRHLAAIVVLVEEAEEVLSR